MDWENKEIKLDIISSPSGKLDYLTCFERVSYILYFLMGFNLENKIIGMEIPPSKAMFAAGLYGLSYSVIRDLFLRDNDLYMFYPSYLGFFFGKRKAKLKDIRDFSQGIFDILTEQGWSIINNSAKRSYKMDSLVGLLFCIRLSVRLGFIQKGDKLDNYLFNNYKKIYEEKEKIWLEKIPLRKQLKDIQKNLWRSSRQE